MSKSMIDYRALAAKRKLRVLEDTALVQPQPTDVAQLPRVYVEGRERLNRQTQFFLRTSDSQLPALHSSNEGDIDINLDQPLPFVTELAHRFVLNRHLWVATEEGRVLVLEDEQHRLLDLLSQSVAPRHILSTDPVAREVLSDLIGKLAVAGFLRGIQGHTDVKLNEPHRFSRFHLTNRCQLSCVHCYADSGPHESAENELPTEKWLELVDGFAAHGGERILFTGGEALVHRGAIEIMRRARARGLDITLFSNGYLIPKHLNDLVDCVDHVQISVDGPDAETNDKIRGEGSFRHAVRAIELLARRNIDVRVGMTLMEANYESMRRGFDEFTARFDGLPVKYRISYSTSQHGRGEDLADGLSADETRDEVEAMLKSAGMDKGRIIARRIDTCGYAGQFVIASDGKVHPCHLLDGAIADASTQSVSEILDVLRYIGGTYSIDHNLGCNRCDIRNLCGGTCRVTNNRIHGNRRITNCNAEEKNMRLENLVKIFASSCSDYTAEFAAPAETV